MRLFDRAAADAVTLEMPRLTRQWAARARALAPEDYGAIQAADQPKVHLRALRDSRRRPRELDAGLAVAEDDADLRRAEKVRDGRDALLDEINAVVGPGRRVRGLGAPPERARTAVRKAITRALDAISARGEVVDAQVRTSVVTGSSCRFHPVAGTPPWSVRTRATPRGPQHS